MTRIPLVTDKAGLSESQTAAFDAVVASRGSLLRPFQLLVHRPAIAHHSAALGATIRFESQMRDADRELVILATAADHGCGFEWDHHLEIATRAGVRAEAIEVLRGGAGALHEWELVLVNFARELCRTASVSDETFTAAHEVLGHAGIVELAAIVGYYTMLAYVMGACDAC